MSSLPVPLISAALTFTSIFLLVTSIGELWDRITRRYIADLKPTLLALSIDQAKIPTYLRWWGLTLLLSFVTLWFVLAMPPIAIAVVYLIYIAPRIVLSIAIDRRQKRLRDQLVGATTALANACRAGLSLGQGMESVARETDPPLSHELTRIVRDFEHGRPLAEAIYDTKQRLNLDSFTLFSSAILVSLERGGRITDALERISQSLEENQRLERKLDADTASGKATVWILAVFPFGFLGLFGFLHPTGTAMLFRTLTGQVIMFLIIALVYASVQWSRRILRIEV